MAGIVDPDYGKVGDLCASLGYDPKGQRASLFNNFRIGVINFRKSFIETHHISDFPIDIAAPIARDCANAYLEERGLEFFPASSEAGVGGKLCYPKHKNECVPRCLSSIAADVFILGSLTPLSS